MLDRDQSVDVLVLVERDGAIVGARLVDPTVGEVVVVALHLAEDALDVCYELLNVMSLSSYLEIVNVFGQHQHQLGGSNGTTVTARLRVALRRARRTTPNALMLQL